MRSWASDLLEINKSPLGYNFIPKIYVYREDKICFHFNEIKNIIP